MTVREIQEALHLTLEAGAAGLDAEVRAGYASDLLSDVMGNAGEGAVWITLQIHENIVAVASLKQLAAILLVNDRQPDPATLEKAEAEGIPVLVSSLPAFELAGRLYAMGVRGQ